MKANTQANSLKTKNTQINIRNTREKFKTFLAKIYKAFLAITLASCNEKPITVNELAGDALVQANTLTPMTLPAQEGLVLPDEWNKRVSIEIGANDNIVQVLYKLAKANNVALNVHYDIDNTTNIIYRANNKPIIDIIEEVAALCNWKISLSPHAIFVTRDNPYLHVHEINLLNLAAKSSIRTGLNAHDKDHTSGTTGSSSSIDTNTDNNIWGEIETYLRFLIESYKHTMQDIHLGKTEAFEQQRVRLEEQERRLAQDRALVQKAQELTVQAIADNKQNTQYTPVYDLSASTMKQAWDGNTYMETNTNKSDQAGNLLAGLAPTNDDTHASSGSGGNGGYNGGYNGGSGGAYMHKQRSSDIAYSINRQAGLIILRAPQYIHREVAKYINYLEAKLTIQVRVEARIIEVALKDEFSMGVNWNSLTPDGNANTLSNLKAGADGLGMQHQFNLQPKTDVQAFISALQNYGKTQMISKPELTILQNEVGIFKVVTNNVYFQLKEFSFVVGGNSNNSLPTIQRTSTPHIIPEGFSMSIQPSIDQETGEVIAHIKPSITVVTTSVKDPAVQLAIDKTKNPDFKQDGYPVLDSREFDTKLRMKPGEWAVLGGHMTKSKKQTGSGVPGTNIPLIGAVLGNKKNEEQVKEIVCLIRAYPENTRVKTLKRRLMEIYTQKLSIRKLCD